MVSTKACGAFSPGSNPGLGLIEFCLILSGDACSISSRESSTKEIL